MSYVSSLKAGALATIAAIPLLSLSVDGMAQTPRPVQRTAAPVKPKPEPAIAPQTAAPPATQGAASGKTGGRDVVAQVGDFTLSSDDVRSYVGALGPRERAAIAQDPALLSQAVRLLLANHLVLEEARGKKWDQQPAMAAQLERVRESAVVELYLQSVSVPPADYPSDEELQKVYEANRSALLMPRQFELAQIFVPLAKNVDNATEDKAKKHLDEVQRKLKAPGADFAAVANENGGENGGELGWLLENQIRPEIRSQVLGLAKGTASEPVKLDDGWHILKLIDTKASYTRTLPEVREQLVQQMRAERAKAMRQAYLGELIKRNPPVLNEIALSKVFGEQASASK